MQGMIGECERLGCTEGLAAGLTMALDGLGADAAPGLVAALPAASAPADADLVPHGVAARVGVSFIRPLTSRALPVEEATALGVRLAAVRLGVTRRLLGACVAHLAG